MKSKKRGKDNKDKKENEVNNRVVDPTRRFRTHIQTDKLIYKPQDVVFIRGFIINAFHLTALDNFNITPSITIRNSLGEAVIKDRLQRPVDSTISYAWQIPAEQPGGEYKIEISYDSPGYVYAQRNFEIRTFRLPRLKTNLEFVEKGYGAGEVVNANLRVHRAEGGCLEKGKVTAIVRIDGLETFRKEDFCVINGVCDLTFALPNNIEYGVGTLTCVIDDGATIETASKTIPIILSHLDIDIYPEGGDLVADLTNGLYIEAFTPYGDPADITAQICAIRGSESTVVGEISTFHEGRGKTTFRPAQNEVYHLKVIKPTGILDTVPLPPVKFSGVSMISPKKVYYHNEPIEIRISATQHTEVQVKIFKHDIEIGAQKVNIDGKVTTVQFTPKADFFGVLRITVFKNTNPIAERLVFRMPKDKLDITVIPDKNTYIPGSKVELKVCVCVNGKPTQAFVGITVTDDSNRKLVEKRKRAPNIQAMVLLEDEVEKIFDANVYFKTSKTSKREKAERAIDLLLGTQGWRRFIYEKGAAETNTDSMKANQVLVRHPTFGTQPFPTEEDSGWPYNVQHNLHVSYNPDAGFTGLPKEWEVLLRASAITKMEIVETSVVLDALKFITGANNAPKEEAKENEEKISNELFGAATATNAKNLPVKSVDKFTRVYAHQLRQRFDPSVRDDFTETVYWVASVKTAENGEAKIDFSLNDSITSFVVSVDGLGATQSVLGHTKFLFSSQKPFYVEPKLPHEVTESDVILAPIIFVNNTLENTLEVRTKVTSSYKAISPKNEDLQMVLKPQTREKKFVEFNISHSTIPVEVKFLANANEKTDFFSDYVSRSISVVPRGIPFQQNHAGVLKANEEAEHKFVIPENAIASSIVPDGYVFTVPTQNITASLHQLIREPYGCFEQTSATVYPLVMAQKYFKSKPKTPRDTIAAADEKLQRGYKRLINFQCKSGGYDWFGQDPGSEVLTAYAILQFTEMQQIMSGVNEEVIKDCLEWLLAKRDGEGNFTKKNSKYGWGSNDVLHNAYILYSLTKAGVSPSLLNKEIQSLKMTCNSSDPYLLALFALTMFQIGEEEAYKEAAQKLEAMQEVNGGVLGAKSTITYSYGKSRVVETTALCTLAWMKDDTFSKAATEGMGFIYANNIIGGFCNTQATVLSLEAIISYNKKYPIAETPYTIKLIVDGQEHMVPLGFRDTPISIAKCLENIKTTGEHTVKIKQTAGQNLTYALGIAYCESLNSFSHEECNVRFETLALRASTVNEGEGTEIDVKLKNKLGQPLPMTMALIGIPGGLEVRHEKLQELVKSNVFAAYEMFGARQLAIYFREMKPNEEISFAVDVIAAFPGSYTGPPSCAYLYYTNEYRHWMEGFKVHISPR